MATVNAASPSVADITAQFANVNAGDTIQVPPGSVAWSGTQQLVFPTTKGITIRGSGAGAGGTVITDNSTASSLVLMNNCPGGGVSRLSNFRFVAGTGPGRDFSTYHGLMEVNGSNINNALNNFDDCWKYRIDHCEFLNFQGCVFCEDSGIGVFDHNKIDTGTHGHGEKTYHVAADWDNDPTDSISPSSGDGSWAASSDFGGLRCTVMEDNFFDSSSYVPTQPSDTTGTWVDGKRGGRVVLRKNTFYHQGDTVVTMHGTEVATQGTRHLEFYDNLIVYLGANQMINQRAGTVLAFNNRVVTAERTPVIMLLTSDRPADPTDWGRASGANPWDQNDQSATATTGAATIPVSNTQHGVTGYNPLGLNAYYVGVAATGTTRARVVISPSPGWANDRWVGYCVMNLSAPLFPARQCGGDRTQGSCIQSSDANSLTLAGTIFNSANLTFAQGDSFAIFRMKNSKNLLGMGGQASNLVLRNPARLASTGQIGNNEVNEPCYTWNNRWGGSTNRITYNSNVSYCRDCANYPADECHYVNTETVMPGFAASGHWVAGATATIGATPDSTGLPSGLTGSYAPLTIAGYGEYAGPGGYDGQYPHPLIGGVTATPTITSGTLAQFIVGATSTCTNPKSNCFIVTTAGFTGNPGLTRLSGTLPSNVIFSDFGDGTARFTGTAAGATPGDYPINIEARYVPTTPDEVVTQTVTVRVTAASAPTGVAVTAPPTGTTYLAPATVTLEASASDPAGSIVTIEYYRGGSTLITSIDATTVPSPWTFNWTGVAAATYSLTVKAINNFGASTTSSPISITVNTPVAGLPAPTIVVSA